MAQIFVGAILLTFAMLMFFGWGIAVEQRDPWKENMRGHVRTFFFMGILFMFAGALMIGYH